MITRRLLHFVPFFAPLILAALLVTCSPSGTQQRNSKEMTESELLSLAKGIHERALTMDTHDDISGNFASDKDDISSPENKRQVSLPKMKKGGLDVEFFAVFTSVGDRSPASYEAAYKNAMSLFEAIHRLPEKYPNLIDIAYSPDDVERIHASGKLVACIGVENGYPIANDISRVMEFYDKGARYITLTHSGHNQICDTSTPRDSAKSEEYGGLSEFGRKVVHEMNRLGMMIDVSHASNKATLEVLALSKAPIIASHSGAYAVNDNPRNVDDATLTAIKRNGGVVQVVSLADYIKKRTDSADRLAALAAVRKDFGIPNGQVTVVRQVLQTLSQEQRTKYRERVREVDVKFPRSPITVQDMVNHIDHIVDVIGADHVGIGTDFDGGGGVIGFNDASESLNVTMELVKRGYSEEDIRKIWGGNLLRVWREVERVARELQSGK